MTFVISNDVFSEIVKVAPLNIIEYLADNFATLSVEVFENAVIRGDKDIIRFLHENNCPYHRDCFAYTRDISVLELLYNLGYDFDYQVFVTAINNNDIKMIDWLFEHDNDCCKIPDVYASKETIEYLREKDYPLTHRTIISAMQHNDLDMAFWLYESGITLHSTVFLEVSRMEVTKERQEFLQWLYTKNCLPTYLQCPLLRIKYALLQITKLSKTIN